MILDQYGNEIKDIPPFVPMDQLPPPDGFVRMKGSGDLEGYTFTVKKSLLNDAKDKPRTNSN